MESVCDFGGFVIISTSANAIEDVMHTFARAYILAMLGIVLFADKSGNQVWLFLLPLLRDFKEAGSLTQGNSVLACLYCGLCRATIA